MERNNNPAAADQQNKGMQGIDKAPGEETPSGTDQFVNQSQKAKNSVDGDLSKEEDRPADQQDL